MTDSLKPRGILLGQIIIGQRPIPQKAVDAYLAWQQRRMPYIAMAEIISDCLMEIIVPLVESDDPNLINFRTGLTLGFFERVAAGVREATGSRIAGEQIKKRVFANLNRRSKQSMSVQSATLK